VVGASAMTGSRHRDAISGNDAIPIEVWAYPEDSVFADSLPFRRATEVVEALSRIVGPFPYSRLVHVESSTRYGGMENATAIFYDENAYVRGTMHESTMRHETAHQWFGDAVTEADWHHLWLSEGFATYFDLVAGAALSGDSVLRAGLRANAAAYMASKDTARPVIDTVVTDPMELLNANSYQKGGWVLHMLRGVVGDSAFFRGIRDYYHTYRDSSVLTAQLEQRMEASAHADLGWFFRQWLTQPGYPRLQVDIRNGGAGFTVRQVQPEAWGRYRIDRLPVALTGTNCPARAEVRLDPRAETSGLAFTNGCVLTAVRLDPDGNWLLRQN
jgi:aminopeptidase N